MPDSSIRLSMVSKTTYLGMIIIYRAWEMEHRPLKCVFSTLRKWLTARCVPEGIRFRLYPQCIVPTLMYGIHEMGITRKGFHKIICIINVYFRRMIRGPYSLNTWIHTRHVLSIELTFSLGDSPEPQPSIAPIVAAQDSANNRICHGWPTSRLTPDYPMSHLDTPSDSSQPHA